MSNTRSVRDALLKGTVALPNAANTVNSSVIDLGRSEPFEVVRDFVVKVASEAATGANNKNISIVLQHSDESNANFTNIAELKAPLLTVTDNNAAGYSAGEAHVSLPPSVKRYLRVSATGEANGGNASDGDLTVELLK